MFKVFVVCLAAVGLGSLAEYIGGRILLPAMGLHAPGYWQWFWAMVFGFILAVIIYIAKEVLD